ncbi:MAG: hypothetical protein UV12_C0001G0112 [Candidatus Nomurabacteria bacterium GW2011_GWC2_42_20]|uniref:Uncharacterized protein n=1 Tax=Candidatus Nomurabacteria bacterium GW2011_GWC2_42_20 TaxID=1618756 RepID=A0A0G0ZI40_9BACT|nr:MAG: hypothetical protein UV12_C0001G0112 [Candidatus Nomurabacteria bacterium GW2011_GWC2_42_20]
MIVEAAPYAMLVGEAESVAVGGAAPTATVTD